MREGVDYGSVILRPIPHAHEPRPPRSGVRCREAASRGPGEQPLPAALPSSIPRSFRDKTTVMNANAKRIGGGSGEPGVQTLKVFRPSRAQVSFTSTLPEGHAIVCPECEGVISADLSGLL